MRIAIAQIDCRPGDLAFNCAKIADFARRAGEQGCQSVFFPEMSDTGYVPSLIPECAQPWPGFSFDAAAQAARENNIAVICGISEKEKGAVYNTAAVFDSRGELCGKYRKTHLFTAAPVHEEKVCCPGSEFTVVRLAGTSFGLSICYDLRFPEVYRTLALLGAQVLVNCTAWPASRPIHWDALTRARAIENQAFFIGAGRVGTDGGLVMHGMSRIVTPRGEVLCEAPGDREDLLVADLDLSLVDEFRRAIPALASRRNDLYGDMQVESRLPGAPRK